MNTLRVMAATGLGLSLAFASGCNSDSKPATKDGSAGGNRGTGGSGAGGGAGGRDAAGTRAT